MGNSPTGNYPQRIRERCKRGVLRKQGVKGLKAALLVLILQVCVVLIPPGWTGAGDRLDG